MKKTLFITGITGFIGSNLLQRLDFSLYEHVFGVGRKENDVIRAHLKKPNFTFINADVLEPKDYIQYLKLSDIVIHMAAVTGKASRNDYFRTNRDGTRVLLANCQQANIERFVNISTIAAKFQDVTYYHYAQSKLAAEHNIKGSAIPFTIIRPTIVIGKSSPILISFEKMIKPPIVPIFGNGKTEIEPIFVENLVDCILHVINHDRFFNEIIEIGGPERTTIEDFMKRLHQLTKKGKYRSIHLPISSLVVFLSVLEKYFIRILPFTAGQLTSFSSSGTSNNNPFLDKGPFPLFGIEEMLSRSLHRHKIDSYDTKSLQQECGTFSRYLINMEASEYTKDKYIQAHKKLGIENSDQLIDHILLKKAQKNVFGVRLGDVYSSVFFPRAIIRQKILLLIAIYECGQSTYARLDSINQNNRISILFLLIQKAVFYICVLLLSIIVFGPFHIISHLGAKSVTHK